jgi:predicted small metal-binding protein
MRSDDIAELMIADANHVEKAHHKQVREAFKQFPLSQLVDIGAKVVKDQKREECSIACGDLGMACDWSMKTDFFLPAAVQVIQHWEQAHAQDLRDRLAKEGPTVIIPFYNAIKRPRTE